ncbi:MAG: hypothetical protein ACLP50_29115 [Solirubrobacteraceae bacterium]
MTGRHSQKQLAVLAAAAGVCAFMIAACGSSSNQTTSTTASSTLTMLTKFSACMRDHGVTGFPDPNTTETPNSFGIDGYNFDLPANMDTQSPAYEAANRTCQPRTAGSGAPHQLPAKAKEALLAHAECMRKHGVPNYPDPTFSTAGGGVTVSSGGVPGMNPRSPAFQQAQKICEGG